MVTDKPEYHELVDAWWKTAEALDALPGCDRSRTDWHANVFEGILKQCGWTVKEWNDAVDLQKQRV